MKNRKCIVYCINSLTGGGGTARVVAQKASYFADVLDYSVHIIVSKQGSSPIDYNFSNKISIHFMDKELAFRSPRVPGLRFYLFLRNARRKYSKLIEEISPDIVTVVGPFFEDLIIPKICKKQNIISIREFHFAIKANAYLTTCYKDRCRRLKLKLQQFISTKQMYKYNCLVILTNSDLKEHRSSNATRIEVIPNVSSIGIIDKMPNLDSKQVISVGSMRSNVKRFDMQIRIWKEFLKKHPDWTLHIYGDGIEMQRLRDLVEELDLISNVFLHGSTSHIGVKYLESSIYLSTSIAEGMPMTILEATEAGLPVVSIDCPCGPSDIIKENVTGYLVKEGDFDILLSRLDLLATNLELRRIMSKNAKIEAVKYFPSEIMPQWVELYESL
ncbi:MAG: glycosyltransferase family 4 protein [Rikenellaceae bacterium]